MLDRSNPLPLYIQIKEHLRSAILGGSLEPGQPLPVEGELARQYGVSAITIKHSLRDLASEGLVVRIKRKGTFVSPRVEARAQRSRTMALVIPDIEDLFLSEIYRGVAAAAREADYQVTILSSDRDSTVEAENLRSLGKHGETGAIIFPHWGRTNAELIVDLKRRGVPFVLVNRFFRDIQTDYVVADNLGGACQAIEHLIELGHRRIGCIGWVECTAVDDRLEGYRLALGRHGIAYDEHLVRSILTEGRQNYVDIEPATGGYNEMRALLELQPRPTAVFAVSDRLVAGALRAVAEKELCVPQDVALVGFDNLRYAVDLDLTTVAQPAFETGRQAATILLAKTHMPADGYSQIVLPVEFIVRGSSGGCVPAPAVPADGVNHNG